MYVVARTAFRTYVCPNRLVIHPTVLVLQQVGLNQPMPLYVNGACGCADHRGKQQSTKVFVAPRMPEHAAKALCLYLSILQPGF